MNAADPRRFRWPLAALQCKLDIALESARLRLAMLRQQEAGVQRALETVEAHQRRTLDDFSNTSSAAFDPAARLRSLEHLVQQVGLLEAKRDEIHALRSRIHSAQDACAAAERQRACVEKMRAGALRAYGVEQTRAEAREADFAWLVLRERDPSRIGAES